jgi:hypothetical protein
MELWLWAEMEEETDVQSRCTEIIEELALVGGAEEASCLHFYGDTVVDEEVPPIGADNFSFEKNGYWSFAFYFQVFRAKLDGKGPLIDRFQKPVSKQIVRIKERTNDLVGALPIQPPQLIRQLPLHPSNPFLPLFIASPI